VTVACASGSYRENFRKKLPQTAVISAFLYQAHQAAGEADQGRTAAAQVEHTENDRADAVAQRVVGNAADRLDADKEESGAEQDDDHHAACAAGRCGARVRRRAALRRKHAHLQSEAQCTVQQNQAAEDDPRNRREAYHRRESNRSGSDIGFVRVVVSSCHRHTYSHVFQSRSPPRRLGRSGSRR
jgi:hypothetical protein